MGCEECGVGEWGVRSVSGDERVWSGSEWVRSVSEM